MWIFYLCRFHSDRNRAIVYWRHCDFVQNAKQSFPLSEDNLYVMICLIMLEGLCSLLNNLPTCSLRPHDPLPRWQWFKRLREYLEVNAGVGGCFSNLWAEGGSPLNYCYNPSWSMLKNDLLTIHKVVAMKISFFRIIIFCLIGSELTELLVNFMGLLLSLLSAISNIHFLADDIRNI